MGTQLTLNHKMNFFRKIFDQAKEKGISINEKKLIACFCLECVSTKRRGEELLEHFLNAELIFRFGDDLMDKDLFKEMKSKQGF